MYSEIDNILASDQGIGKLLLQQKHLILRNQTCNYVIIGDSYLSLVLVLLCIDYSIVKTKLNIHRYEPQFKQ